MKAIGVIPARLHSNRFPKKILHLIDGKPMVVHVYEQAVKAKSLDDVIVATCDKEIADYAELFGADVEFDSFRVMATLGITF